MTFLFFTHTTLVNFFTIIGFSGILVAGALLLLQGAAFAAHLFTKKQLDTWDAVGLYVLIGLVFLATAITHPEYMPYLDGTMSSGNYEVLDSVFRFGRGIYAYYIIRQYQYRSEELFRLLKAVAACLFLNIGSIFTMDTSYSMGFGYHMEMTALIFLAEYVNISKEHRQQKTIVSLVLSFTAIILGILFGSRACVVGYALFILVTLFFKGKPNLRQITLAGLLMVAILIITSKPIMTAVYNTVEGLGFNSRTLYYISRGDLMNDQARQTKIWPMLGEVIHNSSLFKMHGAYADRYYLTGRFVYAHNIVFEIILTFGKFLGSIIILLMVWGTVQVWRKNKNITGVITILFGLYSIAKLWFSSSFWYEPYFWAFLAMLVNSRKEQKKTSGAIQTEFII